MKNQIRPQFPTPRSIGYGAGYLIDEPADHRTVPLPGHGCHRKYLPGIRETSKLIAIIDDDDAMRDSLRDLMEAAGLVARCFGSAEEFLESGLHRQAACLITDILMPKMSGLELQTRLKDEECDIPIIFITAYGDATMRIQAMREGAVEFLAKPFDHHLLLNTVRAALDM